ncbi:SET domain-containing protein [Whalleya microplaca]|nr:SET domain-containing protein [Whalleya microplaca]
MYVSHSLLPRLIYIAAFSALAGSLYATSHDHVSIATKACPASIPAALQPQDHTGCSLLVDDSVGYRPVDWSPWTHSPKCLPAHKKPEVKYCVFTNSQHGNQGVSIITTPETAANNVDMLNDPGTSFARLLQNSSGGASYKIAEIPGKGKGVVATRRIERSETIMADWASIVVDVSFPISVRRSQGYHLFHQAADQLVDPDRLLRLGHTNALAADIMEDVIRTNAFSWYVIETSTPYALSGEPHMAVYPEISRINHACKPNAFIRFSPTSLAVGIIATRRIEPGEEINISYIPMGQTRDERQASLSHWGFNCTCSLCTASKTEIAASDYRRSKIDKMRKEVFQAIEAWDGTRAVKLTHEMLELLRIEELEALYAAQYEILARLYWKAKDIKTATKYAQQSLDVLVDLGYIDDDPQSLPTLLESFTK